jgi:hypothetical protein
VETLRAAPSWGRIQRKANWVSTKAAPKEHAERHPKRTATASFATELP